MAQEIQTLIFNKEESPSDVNDGEGWTEAAAVAWADDHDFRTDKMDETSQSFRLRQFDPDECQDTPQTLTETFPAGVSAVSCDRARAGRRNTMEKRVFPLTEIRVDDGDGGHHIVGHAAVFDQLSDDLGGFREKIDPGAFTPVLEQDVLALWNHNSDLVLGRTKNRKMKTLELTQDDKGLAFDALAPDVTWVRDKIESIRRGDVTGASFAFNVGEDSFEKGKDEEVPIRTIHEFSKLYEVSPGVAFPAYPQTDVALRALRRWQRQQAVDVGIDFEELEEATRRLKKGEGSDDDRQLVRQAAEVLRGLGPIGLRAQAPDIWARHNLDEEIAVS